MVSESLDEQRCSKCNRLLFRGLLGVSFIEAKCNRCGHMNLLHNFNGVLSGRENAYIIVLDANGRIIITSDSAEKVLGYLPEELYGQETNILTHDPDQVPTPQCSDLISWEEIHSTAINHATHFTKQGKPLEVDARCYPLHTSRGIYTMGVFHARGAK